MKKHIQAEVSTGFPVQYVGFSKMVIHTECRKLGIWCSMRPQEREDFKADVMVEVIKAWPSYNSARGRPEAYINQVVSTRKFSVARDRAAAKRGGGKRMVGRDLGSYPDKRSLGKDFFRQIDLAMDLETVFQKLTPRQRAICAELMEELRAPTARKMGMAWSTFRDELLVIREVFRKAGMEEYLK